MNRKWRGEHSRQRKQHDEGPGEGGSPETKGLGNKKLKMRCVLRKCLASSVEIRYY